MGNIKTRIAAALAPVGVALLSAPAFAAVDPDVQTSLTTITDTLDAVKTGGIGIIAVGVTLCLVGVGTAIFLKKSKGLQRS